MQHHVRQQHSNNPLRSPCTICGMVLKGAKSLRLHVERLFENLFITQRNDNRFSNLLIVVQVSVKVGFESRKTFSMSNV